MLPNKCCPLLIAGYHQTIIGTYKKTPGITLNTATGGFLYQVGRDA